MSKLSKLKVAVVSALTLVNGCSTYTLSVNNQPLYDPDDKLYTGEIKNADLQGCINIAMKQQNVDTSTELTILSCANSEISQNNAFRENLVFVDNLSGNTTVKTKIFVSTYNQAPFEREKLSHPRFDFGAAVKLC